MKYLALLLFVVFSTQSCSNKPTCETREMGKILGDLYTILECTQIPKEPNIICDPNKHSNVYYYCVRKG